MKYVIGNKGFSLVEVLISSTIMGVLMMSSIEALRYFQTQSQSLERSTTADALMSSVIANGQATLPFHQRDWASKISDPPEVIDGELQRMVDAKMGLMSNFEQSMGKLPIAFSDDDIGPVSLCKGCKGRYGTYTMRSPIVGLVITVVRYGVWAPGGAPGNIKEMNFLTPAY